MCTYQYQHVMELETPTHTYHPSLPYNSFMDLPLILDELSLPPPALFVERQYRHDETMLMCVMINKRTTHHNLHVVTV